MSEVFFLLVRRLRAPLIMLVCVYSLAIIGMVLIPGVDENGNTWRMSFFHAFYFVSFMGTTIGFGEIPHPFTDMQRAWVLIFIYASVITWLYTIGDLLRLIQDSVFKQAIANHTIKRQIRAISSPFYIICGYNETASLITKGMNDLGFQVVIIDRDQDSTIRLPLLNLHIPPIVLNVDALNPENLLSAGLKKHNCHGVIAVSNNEHFNLQISVICKILDTSTPVICRSESDDETKNMESFGTDDILNVHSIFSAKLDLLVNNPDLYQLHNWFINQHYATYNSQNTPSKGLWIICGYGELGKSIQEHFFNSNIELIFIDEHAEKTPFGTISERGTEAKTLEQAGIQNASLILAGTDDDANNLSILITARSLNPSIYTIGKANNSVSNVLYEQVHCDLIARNSKIIANEVLTLISRPLVTRFVRYSNKLPKDKIAQLLNKIKSILGNCDPITWRLIINKQHAPALTTQLIEGKTITIGDMVSIPAIPYCSAIPLLLQRRSISHIIPDKTMKIELGDEILFCGEKNRLLAPQILSHNSELVDSLMNHNPYYIPLLRWWYRKRNNNNIQ